MTTRTRMPVSVLILLLISVSFSAILTNHPVAGGSLDILDEGVANASVLLIAPDGSRQTFLLTNGQLSVPIAMPGQWLVRIGREQAIVQVAAPPVVTPTSPSYPSISLPLLILASLSVFILLALTALAGWSLAFPPAPPLSPVLEKRRQGGQIFVSLRAGTKPLKDVVLQDQDDHATHSTLRLRARHLPAGALLKLHHLYHGPGFAQANFIQEGQRHTLQCQDGRASLEIERTPTETASSHSTTSSAAPPKPKPLARLPRAPLAD